MPAKMVSSNSYPILNTLGYLYWKTPVEGK